MAVFQSESIKIESLDDMSKTELEQIDVRLRTLMMCTEGTIPGSRYFGLLGDFLDEPINVVPNQIAVELQEKVDRYIPEINIAEVTGTYTLDGKFSTQIAVERRNRND